MKQLIGAVFQMIGLVAGVALVLTPFGKSPLATGPLMWFVFPCGCVAGHLLLISGSTPTQVRLVSMVTGGSLLALALAATVAQFMVSGGLLSAVADSFALWYVASGGFVLGGMAWSLRGFGRGGAAQP
jgi:hypothetical protein